MSLENMNLRLTEACQAIYAQVNSLYAHPDPSSIRCDFSPGADGRNYGNLISFLNHHTPHCCIIKRNIYIVEIDRH